MQFLKRLENVLRNKRLGIRIKIWLTELLVFCTLRYGAKTWSMTVKQLKATHQTLEVILRSTKLQWLGHVHRMDNSRIPKHALAWLPENGKRKCGRPQKSSSDTLSEDMPNIDMAWDDFVADNQLLWNSCVTQCSPACGLRSKDSSVSVRC